MTRKKKTLAGKAATRAVIRAKLAAERKETVIKTLPRYKQMGSDDYRRGLPFLASNDRDTFSVREQQISYERGWMAEASTHTYQPATSMKWKSHNG